MPNNGEFASELAVRDRSAIAFGLGAVALWSTVATAFKISLDHLSPLQLLWLAILTSWVVLGVALLFSPTRSQARTGWSRAWLPALLNPVGYYLILFSAYDRLPGQEAMALNYTWALTMTLLAVPILGQKLTGSDILGGVLAYSGVWVIATRGEVTTFQFANPAGVGLALLSTLLWALYWLLNARDTRPPLVAQFQNFTLALPILTGILLLWEGFHKIESVGLVGAVYVGIFEMGISFLLWQEATRRTSRTARVANLIFLSPPVSLLLLWWIRGEPLLTSTFVGLVLILGGLGVQNKKGRSS